MEDQQWLKKAKICTNQSMHAYVFELLFVLDKTMKVPHICDYLRPYIEKGDMSENMDILKTT